MPLFWLWTQSSADKEKRLNGGRGPNSSRKHHHNGEEKGYEGKEHLAVDVESLQINSSADRCNSNIHTHSPLAVPGYSSSSPNGTKSESDSGDYSNDMPWDHSLVIAEPDIQVQHRTLHTLCYPWFILQAMPYHSFNTMRHNTILLSQAVSSNYIICYASGTEDFVTFLLKTLFTSFLSVYTHHNWTCQ